MPELFHLRRTFLTGTLQFPADHGNRMSVGIENRIVVTVGVERITGIFRFADIPQHGKTFRITQSIASEVIVIVKFPIVSAFEREPQRTGIRTAEHIHARLWKNRDPFIVFRSDTAPFDRRQPPERQLIIHAAGWFVGRFNRFLQQIIHHISDDVGNTRREITIGKRWEMIGGQHELVRKFRGKPRLRFIQQIHFAVRGGINSRRQNQIITVSVSPVGNALAAITVLPETRKIISDVYQRIFNGGALVGFRQIGCQHNTEQVGKADGIPVVFRHDEPVMRPFALHRIEERNENLALNLRRQLAVQLFRNPAFEQQSCLHNAGGDFRTHQFQRRIPAGPVPQIAVMCRENPGWHRRQNLRMGCPRR